jgi:histone-binding protein RBBP4
MDSQLTNLLRDLQGIQPNSHTLKPTRKYTHHARIVNDVQYHPIASNFVGTVSDDLTLQILDLRVSETSSASLVAKGGHTDAINSLAFNPTSQFLVATASGDKTIGIWDLRNVKDKIHTLEGHDDAVTSLSWHPSEPGILGSGSYDRRIIFWDLSRVGDEQLPDDQEDGPPELYVFILSCLPRIGEEA